MTESSFEKIPPGFFKKWQEIANLIANIMNVPAALIMKTEDEFMEVFISSQTEDNPYQVGDKEHWHGLYCKTVIKTQKKLCVPNALKDKNWHKNPDIKLGMISYLGYPINFPDKKPFGTLCVLDKKERQFNAENEKLLLQFKKVIEMDLALIFSLELDKKYSHVDTIQKLSEKNEEYQAKNEELKQANEKLLKSKQKAEESEETYHNLFQNAQVGLFRTRISDGKILESNKQLAVMFGYNDLDEFIAEYKTSGNYVDEGTREKMVETIKENGAIQNFEARFYRKDKSIFWAKYSARIFPDKGWIEGVAEDITEHKQAEEKLRKSQEKYQLLVQNINEGLMRVDNEDRIEFVNDKLCEMFGYAKEELIGKIGYKTLIYEEDQEAIKQKNIDRQYILYDSYVVRGRKKSGEIIWLSISGTALKDNNGKVIGSVGLLSDITERRQAENELRLNEEKYRTVFENTGTATTIIEEDTTLSLVNEEFENLSGYSREELEGKMSWTEFVVSEDLKRMKKYHQNRRKKGEEAPTRYEFRFIDREKKIHNILLNIDVISETKQTVASLLDITNRKKAEEELRESEKRFRVAQEMSPDGFTILHPVRNKKADIVDFEWVYENQAIALINGTDPEKVIGKRLLEEFPSHRGTPIFKAYIEAAKTGNPKTLEDIYVGDILSKPTWLRLVIVSMNDDIAILSQDITERKQAEKKLRESEEKYRAITEKTHDTIFISGKNKLFYINKRASELTGYSLEELYDMNYWQLFHPEDAKKIKELDRKGRKGAEAPTSYEARIITKDNKVKYCDFRITPIKYEGKFAVLGSIRDITDYKESEQQLKATTQLLQSTLESTADGILVVNNNRNVLTHNTTFAEMWDIPNELLATGDDQKLLDYVCTKLQNPQEFMNKLNELYKNPKRKSFDTVQFKDGSIFERYSQPLIINDKPEGRVWSFRDVTKRKKAERELQTIFNMSLDMICIADIEIATFTKVNPAFSEILGYSEEELLGRSFLDFIHPDDLDNTRKIIESNLKKGKTIMSFENRYKTKKGDYRWLNWVSHPDPETGLTYAIAHDITDRKEMEIKLRASENKFHSLVEQAAEMLFLHDTKGDIIEVNTAAEKNTGYSKSELLNMNVLDIDPDAKEREDMEKLWMGLDTSDEAKTFEVRHKRKDGSIYPAEVTLSKVVISDENYMLALARDITERKNYEKEIKQYQKNLEEKVLQRTKKLRETQEELIQKERLATLGEFAGGLSHEIKNPLAIIDSSAVNLQMQDYRDDKLNKHLQKIRKAVKKSENVINSLRRLTKEDDPHFEEVEICDFIKRITKQLKLPDKIKLNLNLPDEKIYVNGDETQLNICFDNLLNNAMDAIKDKGKINITLDKLNTEKCRIKICDTGIGMKKQELARIFEPLYSLKATGIGFGLPLVKQIVESHGGEITVESKPGKGTEITVLLPVCEN